MSWEMGAVRVIFVIIITAAAMHLHPFGLSEIKSASFGVSPGAFLYFLRNTAGKGESEAFAGSGIWFHPGHTRRPYDQPSSQPDGDRQRLQNHSFR